MISQTRRVRALFRISFAVVAVVLAACSDSSGPLPDSDPLAGLAETVRGDTATPPPSTTPTTPGKFVGTIRGHTPGAGTDTLQSSELLQGVRVTAFVRTELNGQTAAGVQVATTLTNAQGYFQLPTLPGGEYVVTFVVPTGSQYQSGWTVGEAWEGSLNSPWFIMLPRK